MTTQTRRRRFLLTFVCPLPVPSLLLSLSSQFSSGPPSSSLPAVLDTHCGGTRNFRGDGFPFSLTLGRKREVWEGGGQTDEERGGQVVKERWEEEEGWEVGGGMGRKTGRGGPSRVNYSGDSSILPCPHLKTTGEWLCELKTQTKGENEQRCLSSRKTIL